MESAAHTDCSMNARECRTGGDVLAAIVATAHRALSSLELSGPSAFLGCLRGTGPGVSLTALDERLEQDHPLTLVSPFEGSERVAGAVWGPDLTGREAGVAKLRWAEGATGLPMHTHTVSDRFIIVLKGRGYFHCSRQSVEAFDGRDVTTIAARERDVFCFTRGVVHTFSTDREPMTLLSCQLPFVPFDAPDQYTLPAVRWIAAERLDPQDSRIVCTGGWTQLI